MQDADRASPSLPYLTHNLPGVGGELKSIPEDFLVEEIPAYEPSGTGEHLFLWVEKRDVPADRLVKHVARAVGIDSRDVGVAGLKDRRAVTRQYLSIPARCAEHVVSIDDDRIRVLRSALHGNKLRTGHLRGNRFQIRVRQIDNAERAAAIVERLRQTGVPNYYGEQRFGWDGSTLELGRDLLCGRKTPRDVPGSQRRFLVRLALSAVQSDLFNRALADRLRSGQLSTVLAGDVMEVAASGGKFLVEDAATEQPRCDARETIITGPMFGPKMKPTAGAAAERESQLLADSGLTMEQFAAWGDLLQGARRPYLVFPQDLACEAVDSDLTVSFSLPSGAYATILLREIMKTDAFDAATIQSDNTAGAATSM